MTTEPARADAWTLRITAGLFVLVASVLFFLQGNRMVFDAIDEGIVLEASQRMSAGAVPYVDFFAYMSPGSYWIQSLVFRCFGLSLLTGRIPVILDLALQCSLVFWLTARLSSKTAAAVAAILFTGFQTANVAALIGQHRWDSATLALSGVCLMVEAMRRRKPAAWWFGAGAAMGAAAWCTPSMGVPIVAIAGWVAVRKAHRGGWASFVAGVALAGVAGAGMLASQGALGAFLRHVAWLRSNYSAVNVMSYGSVNGGIAEVLAGAQGFERAILLALVACMELPAILPLAAIAVWGLAVWCGKVGREEWPEITLLLLSMTALVLTSYPRPDVAHLAFVAALPYALTVIGAARLIPARAAVWVAALPLLFSVLFAGNLVMGWLGTSAMESPVGKLQVDKKQLAGMHQLLAQVIPGQTLYVHPYMPIYYFITQAANPTRFSYLAPGMMKAKEEAETLDSLRARPPEWVLYLQLSKEEFLRVFPAGAGVDPRFRALEGWLEENYKPVTDPKVNVGGYELWRRRAGLEAYATTSGLVVQ